ncbi:MAG: VWA domain-containing protein [Acidobacteria bacterium]|nr:MAG: VWA domain-containing protein [Acidobacteriota bacterium]
MNRLTNASLRPVGLCVVATWLTVLLRPDLVVSLQAQQPQELFLSILDPSGVPVTDLRQDEVTVLEDGMKRETLKLEPINWPVKLVVLVDNGAFASNALVQLRNGLRAFFEAIPEGIEMSLVTLNPQPRAGVRPTTERQKLIQGIDLVTPDSGGARFAEGLLEAVNRFDKDKSNSFPVIMVVGTDGAESSTFRERDVERLSKKITEHAVTVHVLMLSLGGDRTSATSGALQVQLGLALTEQTGGKYESIVAATRLQALLPEFGQRIAKSHLRQSHQYRITYQRPAGAGVPSQGISATTSREGLAGMLSLDGRVPEP